MVWSSHVLSTAEQKFYLEPLPDVWAPHPISLAKHSHPPEETHFGYMHPQSLSFGHYPQFLTLVNRLWHRLTSNSRDSPYDPTVSVPWWTVSAITLVLMPPMLYICHIHTKMNKTSQLHIQSEVGIKLDSVIVSQYSFQFSWNWEFKVGQGLFSQFHVDSHNELIGWFHFILFYLRILRHNIHHISINRPIPQALNILQACPSLPNGNTTSATVSRFLFKAL